MTTDQGPFEFRSCDLSRPLRFNLSMTRLKITDHKVTPILTELMISRVDAEYEKLFRIGH